MFRYQFKIFLISIGGFLLSDFASGQVQHVKFNHLVINDGLPQSTINCIYKDHRGYMWFGTSKGLSKYNGYKFVNYFHDAADTTSLLGDEITDITEDKNGNLWISTFTGGLNKYNRDKDNFIRYVAEDTTGNPLAISPFRDIYVDNKNTIWVGSLGTGLLKLENNHLIPAKALLTYSHIAGIVQDKDVLWLSTTEGYIIKYNPKTGNHRTFIYNQNFKGTPSLPTSGHIMLDKQGILWICSQEKGLVLFDTKNEEFRFNYTDEKLNKVFDLMATSTLEAGDQQYWITSNHGGLIYYDQKKQKWIIYKNSTENPFSISNNQVYTAYLDNTNILWTGNYLGGINYFTVNDNKFILYQYDGTDKSISYNSILEIYEDKEGIIWIGTDGGGLDQFDPKTQTFKYYKHNDADSKSLSSNVITAIYRDSKNRLWIGTYAQGLNLFDPKTGIAKHYKYNANDPNSISHNNVWHILEDSFGVLWIGTCGAGLDRYVEKNSDFYRYPVSPTIDSALSDANIYTIFEDSRRNLWIGTTYGLNRYDRDKNIFYKYIHDAFDTTSISHNAARSINEDKNGNLWIGTTEGLNKYNYDKDYFEHPSLFPEMRSYCIQSIEPDKHGNLWLGTYKGLFKYNPESETLKNYEVTDGLQSNEFNTNTSCKTHDGMMLFGGVAGLNMFYPDSIRDNVQHSPIEITGFYLFNKPISSKTPGSPLKNEISETKKIILSHTQNFISLEYALLNYIDQNKNKYKYYLEGLEKQWNDVGSRRVATYTGLKPGKYIFHVKGADYHGYWSNNDASVEIIVLKPFWQKWWFRIIVICIIVFMLYGIYLMRVKQIKNRNEMLKRVVDNQTRELHGKNDELLRQTNELSEVNSRLEERQQQIEEQTEELKSQAEELENINDKLNELNSTKDKFFSIIAHDLKNPFNTIMGYSELMISKGEQLPPEKREMYAKAIHTSTRTVSTLLENLLQWSRSQTNTISFVPEKIPVKSLFAESVLLLKESYSSKSIDIETRMDEGMYVYADRDMLGTIIRNLLSNAIKFTPEKGHIVISCENRNKEVLISITDNGIGMPKEVQHKIFRMESSYSTRGTKGETGTGLGLILCKEFVEKHKGKIWVESKENKGTTFYFTIPVDPPK